MFSFFRHLSTLNRLCSLDSNITTEKVATHRVSDLTIDFFGNVNCFWFRPFHNTNTIGAIINSLKVCRVFDLALTIVLKGPTHT